MGDNTVVNEYLTSIGKQLAVFLTFFSPKLASRLRYRKAFGRKLNLDQPQEFNEKLMWLKLNTYYKNPLVIQCADKVRVREYVKQCGCDEILIDCLGVYKTAGEIPWETLPDQFVLKCNHGGGYNIVCPDKNQLNIPKAKSMLTKWLKQDYSLLYAEMHYHYIKPLIICEKYLRPSSGILPDDYKIYCFHGKAACIMVCQERRKKHCNYYMMDTEWNYLDWIKSASKEIGEQLERPACLNQMIVYAEKLAKDFPFVRIDLYVINNQIYFGEMTFTPCGCIDTDYTEAGNRELSGRLRVSSS